MKFMNLALVVSAVFVGCVGSRHPQVAPPGQETTIKTDALKLGDRGIADSVAYYSGNSKDEIRRRIDELEREWDMERLLETNASALAFAGQLLGVMQSKKWLLLPAIVLPFLFQHAVQGWCPPVPIFRRWGIRTREEIDHEKYALKALCGDFVNVGSNPENAVHAAKA